MGWYIVGVQKKDSGSFDYKKIKNVEGPRVEKLCEYIHKAQRLEATILARNC